MEKKTELKLGPRHSVAIDADADASDEERAVINWEDAIEKIQRANRRREVKRKAPKKRIRK